MNGLRELLVRGDDSPLPAAVPRGGANPQALEILNADIDRPAARLAEDRLAAVTDDLRKSQTTGPVVARSLHDLNAVAQIELARDPQYVPVGPAVACMVAPAYHEEDGEPYGTMHWGQADKPGVAVQPEPALVQVQSYRDEAFIAIQPLGAQGGDSTLRFGAPPPAVKHIFLEGNGVPIAQLTATALLERRRLEAQKMGHGLPTAEWEKLVADSWPAAIAQWKEDNWRGIRVEVKESGRAPDRVRPAFTGTVLRWTEGTGTKICVQDDAGETHWVQIPMPTPPREMQTAAREARCAILTDKLRKLQALPAGSRVTATRVEERTGSGKKKKVKAWYEFHLAQVLPKKIAYQVLIFSDDQEAQEKGAALTKAILDVFRRRKPNFGLYVREDRAPQPDPWLKEMEKYWSAPVDREYPEQFSTSVQLAAAAAPAAPAEIQPYTYPWYVALTEDEVSKLSNADRKKRKDCIAKHDRKYGAPSTSTEV